MSQAATPLAIVGMACSGKSEVSDELVERFGFAHVYFGQVVLDEVEARGLPLTPESERIVREQLRSDEGMDVMARRSLPRIRTALQQPGRVCLDGLYSGAEWELLSQEIGLVTLAVHAPRWLRKQRAASRTPRPLSAAELDARDLAEVANLDKAAPIALADLHVVNDGSKAALSERIAAAVEALPQAADGRLVPAS